MRLKKERTENFGWYVNNNISAKSIAILSSISNAFNTFLISSTLLQLLCAWKQRSLRKRLALMNEQARLNLMWSRLIFLINEPNQRIPPSSCELSTLRISRQMKAHNSSLCSRRDIHKTVTFIEVEWKYNSELQRYYTETTKTQKCLSTKDICWQREAKYSS